MVLKKRYERIGYLFVLPALIYMCCLMIYPIFYNIALSFKDVNMFNLISGDKPFVGFQNYMKVFSEPLMKTSILNTFYYTVGSILFQFVLGFLFALLFTGKFRCLKPMRGLLMITYILPVTVTSILFKFMFDTNCGVINQTLLSLGLIPKAIPWLLKPTSAMWATIITNIWCGIPFNMMILSAGLTSIPTDIYESAVLDGASVFQKFFYITLPLMRTTIEAVLVLGFVYTFRVFDLIFVLTNGGPVNSTEVLSTYSYKRSFVEFNFSQGAAIANVLFVILLVVGLIYTRLIKSDEAM
ncbi:MAG TPA: sugar ABC transporter permease [Clostridia bacterium]|nr:sugar ABC transporter permease [Clostridia bacterium]